MEANGIDFHTAVDANVNSFEWLIGREFVIEEDYFRLNDVARDVLRRSQCKANQKKFRETHALLAKYFQRLANGEVNAEQAAQTDTRTPNGVNTRLNLFIMHCLLSETRVSISYSLISSLVLISNKWTW
jgi:hypothetical protein